MILTPAELDSLVNAQHPSPHQLLGMHPLGDGSGLVVRAFLQNAASVEVAPVHEPEKPRFALQMLDARGLFEGTTQSASRPYAY
ncbi:MAG: 1,4-alpha-glucan branching enzyme, partial [Limisphaerales bacterium]